LLRRIHGDTRHRGKAPSHGGAAESGTRLIQRLHDDLQRAVEREEFEKAAGIRDEIRRIEREPRATTPGDRS
jgi:protein arginine kinase activator